MQPARANGPGGRFWACCNLPVTTPATASAPTPPLAPLGYHTQRLRHAQVLLLRWGRRWAVFLATGLLLLAAGASSAWHIAATVLGALVAPLLVAGQHPAWGLALTGAYALLCGLPVVATRPLWWPRRWAEAERALPLPPAVLLDSDRRLQRWLLGPPLALLWAGMGVLAWEQGRSQPAALATAALALVVAGGTARWWTARWMHHLRRQQGVLHHDRPALPALPADPAARPTLQRPTAAIRAPHTAPPLRRVAWPRALWWWPLWRGQARRTARGLVLACTATPALAAAPLAAPATTGWWLAALAGAVLVATAWLRSRTEVEFQTRWPRLCHLPITPTRWRAAQRSLVLAPLALAAALALAATGPLLMAQGARLGPWLGYWAALAVGAALEALPPPADAGHHAARALLCLVLAVALGSEVWP